MKVIEDICGNVFLQAFPPGHYFSPDEGLVQYYKVSWVHVCESSLYTGEDDSKDYNN